MIDFFRIRKVDKTNDEYKNIQTLSVTLNNVDNQIQENQKEIQTLTENNEALQLRVDTLTRNNKVKDKQIKDLKEENLSLRQSLSFWKDKFLKVISFIKDKLFAYLHLECFGYLLYRQYRSGNRLTREMLGDRRESSFFTVSIEISAFL